MRFKQIYFISLAMAILFFAVPLLAQSLSDLDQSGFEHQSGSENVQSGANPFAGGTSSKEDLAVEDLELTGIVYRSAVECYALISGYLVRNGDLIAGYRVDKIEKNKVRLRRLDEVLVLALAGGM